MCGWQVKLFHPLLTCVVPERLRCEHHKSALEIYRLYFTFTQYSSVTNWMTLLIFHFIMHRVRTDPGKVWNVMEFTVEIFQALKSLEVMKGMKKSGKILENYEADMKNIDRVKWRLSPVVTTRSPFCGAHVVLCVVNWWRFVALFE